MLLKTAHIQHFKCIRDSTPFKVDERVTCLVGKNESGKTALLQALSKINPLDEKDCSFDFDLEYPRDAWDEGRKALKENVVTVAWGLEDDDIAAISAVLGDGAIDKDKDITVSQGYYEGQSWKVTVNEPAVVKWLVARHELHADVRDDLVSSGTVKELHERLGKNAQPGPKEIALLQCIEASFPELSATKAVMKVLGARIPKIVYIPEYFRMSGQISLNELKAKIAAKQILPEGQRVFMALLDMIGATIKDLEDESQFERLTARLESASNKLSREIFQYWSQNRHLRVEIRFDQARQGDPTPLNSGWIVRTRVENTRHNSTVGFDDRSAGFVWFFSFLVWFSQAQKNYGQNLIILLDEPGLSLHAKAQADLLRYVEEKLAPYYQVFYTTHSPFMIDPENLLRARTVEDVFREPKEGEPPIPEDELGTKVGGDVLSTDRDTVFPLQAALGYEITQTLFVGNHTLLVEGPADIIYLRWFSRRLEADKRQGLDRRWTISPSGGIDKVPAFMSLFAGNRLDIAVFTDLAAGQKRKVRDIRESKLLKAGRVLTADTYAEQPEADIEDVIGREMYRDVVNQTYQLEDAQRIPTVRPAGAPERAVKEAEQHFALLPPDAPSFDHYGPAEFLLGQGGRATFPGLAPALDRFERLFSDLNSMLP
jgi:predicted ATPase